jgi:Amt family ammonium transporter
MMKAKFKYDDSLDAFGVHGIGGTVGALLTGIFCSEFLPTGTAGGLKQFLAQTVAVIVTALYATVVTAVLVLLVERTMGLRVPQDEEMSGLDVARHGESAYNP